MRVSFLAAPVLGGAALLVLPARAQLMPLTPYISAVRPAPGRPGGKGGGPYVTQEVYYEVEVTNPSDAPYSPTIVVDEGRYRHERKAKGEAPPHGMVKLVVDGVGIGDSCAPQRSTFSLLGVEGSSKAVEVTPRCTYTSVIDQHLADQDKRRLWFDQVRLTKAPACGQAWQVKATLHNGHKFPVTNVAVYLGGPFPIGELRPGEARALTLDVAQFRGVAVNYLNVYSNLEPAGAEMMNTDTPPPVRPRIVVDKKCELDVKLLP